MELGATPQSLRDMKMCDGQSSWQWTEKVYFTGAARPWQVTKEITIQRKDKRDEGEGMKESSGGGEFKYDIL
jgi:hypothetical protein